MAYPQVNINSSPLAPAYYTKDFKLWCTQNYESFFKGLRFEGLDRNKLTFSISHDEQEKLAAHPEQEIREFLNSSTNSIHGEALRIQFQIELTEAAYEKPLTLMKLAGVPITGTFMNKTLKRAEQNFPHVNNATLHAFDFDKTITREHMGAKFSCYKPKNFIAHDLHVGIVETFYQILKNENNYIAIVSFNWDYFLINHFIELILAELKKCGKNYDKSHIIIKATPGTPPYNKNPLLTATTRFLAQLNIFIKTLHFYDDDFANSFALSSIEPQDGHYVEENAPITIGTTDENARCKIPQFGV